METKMSNTNELVEKYLKLNVQRNKIISTKQSSVVNWSVSRKCVVDGETGIEPMEILDDGNGNKRLSFENNRLVIMQIRTELTKDDIDQINNSDGIICTDVLYGREGYRYGFIPTVLF